MSHMNQLQRRNFLRAGALLAAASPFFKPQSLFAQEAPKKKILFFSKSQTFEHSTVASPNGGPSFAGRVLQEFGGPAGFEFDETKDGSVFDGDLSQYDAFFFYTTGDLTKPGKDQSTPMSEKGKRNLLDAVASGKGMLGSHCASDTFHSIGEQFENQSERDPYIQMLGGEFIRHGKQQPATMRVVDSKFPGMEKGGESFSLHEEWYSLKNFAEDIHVLLVQETDGMEGFDYERPPFPATWVRMQEKGRVFYTSMGHREDVWTNPIFQAAVVGGLNWATGRVDAEIPANMAEVTPHAVDLPKKS